MPDDLREPVRDSRSARKREAILDAAAQVFLGNGYVGTSMDQIAAVAAVSKQTVYKHFADKETLFRELITTTVHQDGQLAAHSDPLRGELPFDQELRAFARRLVRGVMQPRVLQLRRLVIGEATRFPTLGRTFYDSAVGRTTANLATAFTRLAADGRLKIDDPRLAAEHFIWLTLSIPLNRAMLVGDDHGLRSKDFDRYADAGVDVFLAAYSPAA
jgi:TetR/AcrR family transcriptional regulator, mexJK operon transcriptional repressor